jgi:hypothetical protein
MGDVEVDVPLASLGIGIMLVNALVAYPVAYLGHNSPTRSNRLTLRCLQGDTQALGGRGPVPEIIERRSRPWSTSHSCADGKSAQSRSSPNRDPDALSSSQRATLASDEDPGPSAERMPRASWGVGH